MRKEKLLIFLLITFLLCDLSYSFMEYYYTPIDGDLTAGTVPIKNVQQVLDDPFGFKMLASGEKHINPNRYFSHLAQKEYMDNIPILLQTFVSPITSVYLACALLKLFVHAVFLLIVSWMISGGNKPGLKNLLLAAALLVPLIQANGYWGHMGINDKATTYVFFFALPLILLLAFLVPVYQLVYQEKSLRFGFFNLLASVAFAIVLPLSGPLIPGVVLIICLLILIYYTLKSSIRNVLKEIPRQLIFILLPIALVSVYALILGRFDSNYAGTEIPVLTRYLRLPLGIYYQITQSLGVPLLLLMIIANVILIRKYLKTAQGIKITNSLKWIGLFALIYLLLLPLGGYRPYRPNILRYDTFIPITIALLYFYGKSTLFIVNNLGHKRRNYYGLFLLVIFGIYMNADRMETEEYQSERQCLEILAKSPNDITKLPATFNVMSWEPLPTPERTEGNAIMLMRWNITDRKKLYYQSNE